MAYSSNRVGNTLYITDALTNSPIMSILIQSPIIGFYISGDTATLNFQDGKTQVWDLKKKKCLRPY